eukprot:250477_1
MSTNECRKYGNPWKLFMWGLQEQHVKKYFINYKSRLQYGRFLKKYKMIKSIIQCSDTLFLAQVLDPNDKTAVYNVTFSSTSHTIKNEADINPVNTVCDCDTYKLSSQELQHQIIKEILCGCIGAVMLSLIDYGRTTSAFTSRAEHIYRMGTTFIVGNIKFDTSKFHPLCPSADKIFDDLDVTAIILKHKYTAVMIMAYASNLINKTIYCGKCGGAGEFNLNNFTVTHKCRFYNQNNINPYKNQSVSMFSLSILFGNIDFTKFLQIWLKLMRNPNKPFNKIASECNVSSNLVSHVFHTIARICSTVMKRTVQFGQPGFEDLEMDGLKFRSHKYIGNKNKPKAHEQSWVERIIGRDRTRKGGKPIRSKIGGAESVPNYGPFMHEVSAPGANKFSDDHKFHQSHYMNKKWKIQRTKHKGKSFTNKNTQNFPARLKGHDNNAEQSNVDVRLQQKIHRGMGMINNGRDETRQNHLGKLDWRQTYTDGTTKDSCVTFLEHTAQFLSERMCKILTEKGWKENQ